MTLISRSGALHVGERRVLRLERQQRIDGTGLPARLRRGLRAHRHIEHQCDRAGAQRAGRGRRRRRRARTMQHGASGRDANRWRPVGRELGACWLPCHDPTLAPPGHVPLCRKDGMDGIHRRNQGSIIIIVVGTNAPLSSTQLNRLVRRASMGLARFGSFSGDIHAVFRATVQGAEEASSSASCVSTIGCDPNGHLAARARGSICPRRRGRSSMPGGQKMSGPWQRCPPYPPRRLAARTAVRGRMRN